jgi:hypothetical protein
MILYEGFSQEILKIVLAEEVAKPLSNKRLRKWASNQDVVRSKDHRRALEVIGAVPIPSGGGDAHLGGGGFGDVYEVLWKGHRATAKITNDDEDASAYREMMKVRASLPPEIRRHVVNVYFSRDVKELQDYDKKTYVTVMEYLHPLPAGLAEGYWGEFSDDSAPTVQILHQVTLEFIQTLKSTVLKYLTKPANQFLELSQKDLKTIGEQLDHLNDEILRRSNDHIDKRIKKLARISFFESTQFRVWFRKAIEVAIIHGLTSNTRLDKDEKITLAEDIYYQVTYIPDRIIRKRLGRFPVMSREMESFDQDEKLSTDSDTQVTDQRVVDLFEAMKALSSDHSIDYDDLHSLNVMYRPSDDCLVATDIGMFSF